VINSQYDFGKQANMTQNSYRLDIQVLRGLAVLAVVLFHAKADFIPSGFLGVDVFFVISGFVVTPLILRIFTQQTNRNKRLKLLKLFYRRRFYRLAPALTCTLVFSAILIFLLGPTSDHSRFAKQGIATLFLAGNIGAYHFNGNYFNSNPNPLLHTWSLSVEEQIYIFLPLVAVFIFHLLSFTQNKFEKLLFLITGFSMFVLFSPSVVEPLYLLIGLNSDDEPFKFWFYSPLSRVWQFTIGGICFLMLSRTTTLRRQTSLKFNSIILFVFMITIFGRVELSSRLGAVLASSVTCLVIIYSSLNALPRSVFLILKWIGDRSYSIYLVHMPLLYIAKYAAVTSWGRGENRMFPTIIAVIATFILGSLSYKVIENKYRNKNIVNEVGIKVIFKPIIATLLLPLFLFLTINQSVQRNYWGLKIDYAQAPSALGNLNDCEEDPILRQIICMDANNVKLKTVLLMGDSHAEHLRFALREAAMNADWNSVYIGGKIESLNTEKRVSIEEWLQSNKVDLIIISQFWNETTLRDEVANNLVYLKTLVPNVLLLENNPIWPDSARFRLAGYLIAPQDFLPKTFPSSQMRFTEKNISDQISKLAIENGIDAMNFDELFCSSNTCTRYSKSGWLYNDYNHFSTAGANLTIPLFKKYLGELK
jgi:peptidoglycan/LPS O-acetylase OafA/YrhL